ncbi:hypothetical protein QVD17_24433 [Tagetes erecta]|uniref:BED-type domain-containing protein n=1 Tax=Tagetes erecta TaxID=13708 RepID=A0AAD8NV14_TARER|nr:hypothetical protein QVD17_24433 [Tagetes erecta]
MSSEVVYCKCGKEATIRTSYTSRNPGHRSYSCPAKGSDCKGCIKWVNERKQMDLTPGLLKAINVLEDSNEKLLNSNNELKAKLKASEDQRKKNQELLGCRDGNQTRTRWENPKPETFGTGTGTGKRVWGLMDKEGEEVICCDSSNTHTHVDSNKHVQDTNQSQEQTHSNTHEYVTKTEEKKRKLTSLVWDHFKKIKINGEEKAECNYCKSKLGAKSKNGTKHLHAHLKSCPNRKNKDLRQQVLSMNQINTSGNSDISCYSFDGDISRRDLAEMIIAHGYPLSIVEHHGFRKFVRGLQPFFKVPSRNTLKSDVLKIYDYEKQKTMRILEKNPSRIAITTDMWTSSNQKKGFMAITTHFIDDSWEMQSRVMRFIYVPCPHTAEVLANVLYESLCDWNIDRKVSTITVDNCTTNDLLIQLLLDKLSLSDLILGGRLFHMRCCAHILNLIVQDGLSIIAVAIEKVRDSVSFWTATQKRIEKFEAAAHHLAIPTSKALSLDVKTRWNSTYLMLNVAIIYKDVFKRLKQRDAQYNSLPSEKEWNLASSICQKLKIFHEVTELFSGTKYPTANKFFKSVYEIKFALDIWSLDDDQVIKDMANKMILKYNKYWSVIHGFMGVAAILDPRYKLTIMKFSFPKLYGSDEGAKAEIEKHRKFMYELFEDYKTKGYENVRNQDHSRPTSNNNTSESGLFDDYSSYVAEENTSGGLILELDHYLEEKVCSPNMDLDILAWWKTNGLKYPILQKIARDILAIPITTVASESSFSTSGRLISPHRSRLHLSTVEALMCAQSWLLNEIKATYSKETEAYCQTIEYEYDGDDEGNDLKE